MPADAELRILGPIELVVAGVGVPIGGPRQRTILARLALARGGSVPTGILIDDVWRDSAPPNAAKSLTTQLTRLRRALQPHGAALEHASAGYRLHLPDGMLDLDAFEQDVAEARALAVGGLTGRAIATLRTALSRWRGEPLADAVDVPFMRAAAEALAAQRRSAEDELVALHLRIRDLGPAIGLLERLVQDTPYDEARWALLVQALAAAGRRREAIAAFQRVRSLLRDDLGIEPGEQLRRIELAVLRSTTDDAVTGDRVRHWTEPPMVGRASELATLDGALARTAEGLQLVLVSGEPGIGKSRLLNEFGAAATRRGATVLRGACEPGSVVPLRAVLAAVQPILSGDEALDLAADPVLLELLGLLDRTDRPPTPDALDLTRFRLIKAITNVLEKLAHRTPVVLAVDDVQWADPFTVAVLHHLLTEAADCRLVTVAAARATPAGLEQLWHLAAALRTDGPVEHLDLAPLPADQAQALLGAMPGVGADEDLAAGLLAASGGNPLFLTQLALHRRGRTAGTLPTTVEAVCRERIEELPSDTAAVLAAAAVIGARFDEPGLAAMLDRPPRDVGTALDRARAAGLLVPDGTSQGHRFVHGVIRDALLRRLPDHERQRLHHRAASSVARAGRDAAILAAQHLAAAQPLSRPSEVYVATMTAGELAASRGALEAAAELYDLAEQSAPSDAEAAAAAIEAGVVARALGRDAVARRCLERGTATGRRLGRWDLVADAILVDAELGMAVSTPDALARAGEVEDVLRHLPDHHVERRARLLSWLALLLVNIDARRTETALAEAEHLAASIDGPATRRELAYARLRQREALADDPAACEASALALADDAAAAGDDLAVVRAHLMCQSARLRGGRFRRVRKDLPSFLAAAAGVRRPVLELGLLSADVAVALATEPLEEADARSEELSDRGFAAGVATATLARAIQVLLIRREQCRLGELAPLIDLYAAADPGRPLQPWIVMARLDAGDLDEARSVLVDSLDSGITAVNRDWMREAVLAATADVAYDLDYRGEHLAGLWDGLAPSIDQFVLLASFLGVLGQVRRYLGRLAHLRDDLDAAVDLCAEARTRELEAGSDLWAGWSGRDEAAARLARGRGDDHREAARLLADAGERATRVGSERLHRSVRALADASA